MMGFVGNCYGWGKIAVDISAAVSMAVARGGRMDTTTVRFPTEKAQRLKEISHATPEFQRLAGSMGFRLADWSCKILCTNKD
jgi:hypothetical protein